MKSLIIIALILASTSLHAAKCEKLYWKQTQRSADYAKYRGKIKPGSADVVHLELYRNSKLVGQSLGYPNPNGTFQIAVFADQYIKRKFRPKFTCEKWN